MSLSRVYTKKLIVFLTLNTFRWTLSIVNNHHLEKETYFKLAESFLISLLLKQILIETLLHQYLMIAGYKKFQTFAHHPLHNGHGDLECIVLFIGCLLQGFCQ